MNKITVKILPEGKLFTMQKANTALQLLNRLDLKPNQALIIRRGTLLTPDVKLKPGDEIEVRRVTSVG